MNRYHIILILKVLAAVVAAILSVVTVASCNVSRRVDSFGHTVITTVDTTHVNHSGYIFFPKK